MILSSTTLTDVTAKPSIMEEIESRTGCDTNSYPYADRLRRINIWLRKFAILAFNSSLSWDFDDTTYTDFSIATTNIVNDQVDYEMPTGILQLKKIEIKNSSGDWVRLEQVAEEDIRTGQNNSTAGVPSYYYLVGNSIFFDKKPDTSQLTATAGLKLWFSREINELGTDDASVEPGIPEFAHDYLSLGPSLDYCVDKDMGRANNLNTLVKEKEAEISKYYSKRNLDYKTTVRPKVVSYD